MQLIKTESKHIVVERVTRTRQVWYPPLPDIPTPPSGGEPPIDIPVPPPNLIPQNVATIAPCTINGNIGVQIVLIDSNGNIIALLGPCMVSKGLKI